MNTIYIVSLFFKDNPKPVDYEFIDEGEAKRNLAIWTNLSKHMEIKIKFSIKKGPKDDSKKIEKLKIKKLVGMIFKINLLQQERFIIQMEHIMVLTL